MNFLLSWRIAEVAVLLQGTCRCSAFCWPILSQVVLEEELTIVAQWTLFGVTSKRLQALHCPAIMSQDCFGFAHSWAQAGLSAVDRSSTHGLPWFSFSLRVPVLYLSDNGWETEGEKQQPFIAITTKKNLTTKGNWWEYSVLYWKKA